MPNGYSSSDQNEQRSGPLVLLKSGGPVAVFLFPGAGGEALSLQPLAMLLNNTLTVYGFHPPDLVAYSLYVKETAMIALQAIKSLQQEGPYYLGGYSYGGIIAFELANLLEKQGDKVAFLGLIDTYPPGPRLEAPPLTRLIIHIQNMRGLSFKEVNQYFMKRSWRFISQLPRRNFFRHFFHKKKNLLEQVATHDVLGAARATTIMQRPDFYIGKITLFVASERQWYVKWDPLAGWDKYTAGGVERIIISRDHFSIANEPSKLAHSMNLSIEQVRLNSYKNGK